MAQLGADVEQLEELALFFDDRATNLHHVETSVGASIRSTSWTGPDADTFRQRWDTTLAVRLRKSADALTELGATVRRQVAEQRRASDAVMVSPQALEHREMLESTRHRSEAIRAESWAERHGAREIREVQDQSRTEQRAWWDALSPTEQGAMIAKHPGRVAGLEGLPKADLARARGRYLDERSGVLITRSKGESVTATFDIKVASGSVEASALTEVHPDGSADVTMGLRGEMALSVYKALGIEGGADVAVTYSFDSEAEATEFVDRFKDSLKPDGPLDHRSYDDEIEAGRDVLKSENPSATTYGVDTKATVSTELVKDLEGTGMSPSVSAKAGQRLTYESESGETTFEMNSEVSADLKLSRPGTLSGTDTVHATEASMGMQARVVGSSDGLERVELQFDVAGGTSLGAESLREVLGADFSPTVDRYQMHGMQATALATFDLTNPATRETVMEAVRDFQSGNLSGSDLRDVLDKAEVTVQVGGTDSTMGGPGTVLGNGVETETTNYDSSHAVVKPAGGDFTRVTDDEMNGR